MKRLGILVLLMACGGDTETQPKRSSSEPVSSTPVAIDLGGIQRPDGKEPLTASQLRLEDIAHWVPGASDLEPGELEVLLEAVNLTTAACEPCMSEGMSLGACAKRWLPSCSNLPQLMHRAFRGAIQGGDLAQVQESISFVEPWQSFDATTEVQEGAVHIVLAVDYLDPFTHRAWLAWQTLRAEYGDALEFEFLHLPHERHEGARELAELALLARGLKQELAFHEAVMSAGDEPDFAALKSHPLLSGASENGGSDVAKILEGDGARLSELGVDSTPVAWIDGYRVTGQRNVAVLQRFVDLALAD